MLVRSYATDLFKIKILVERPSVVYSMENERSVAALGIMNGWEGSVFLSQASSRRMLPTVSGPHRKQRRFPSDHSGLNCVGHTVTAWVGQLSTNYTR